MTRTVLKCVTCGGDYIHERGKGARAINMAHLCGTCLNPIKPTVRPAFKNPDPIKPKGKKG